MFEGKEVNVILAQAGSGKTHNFMDKIAIELETRRAEEIAFVTFTKKGAEEGVKRMCNSFMYSPDDLPYFRTLHSLTFRALNLKSNQMFNHLHERKFNKVTGYNVNRCEASIGNIHTTKDSNYLEYYDLKRSGALTSKMAKDADIELGYYHQLVHTYEEYKRQQCLVDFFDCLINYVQVGVPLPVKVVFIDEAQDITALQWQVIEKAFIHAEKIFITGDTSQSIYSYAGARTDILLKLAKQYNLTYLESSYRLPKKVFELARGIVSFISEKIDEMPFTFHEGNEEGSVIQLSNIERLRNFIEAEQLVNKKTTSWYMLSRNKCFLTKYTNLLEDNLIPYWTADGFFMGGKILTRIVDYEGFRLEGYKNEKKKEEFKKKYGIENFDKHFTETNLFTEERKWVYASYIEKYGLDTLKAMNKWYPQILVSTIHHVKGGEADNVVLMLDNTKKTVGAIYENIDEELRVLYVGVTRAKKNLILIDSINGAGYDKIIATLKDQFALDW